MSVINPTMSDDIEKEMYKFSAKCKIGTFFALFLTNALQSGCFLAYDSSVCYYIYGLGFTNVTSSFLGGVCCFRLVLFNLNPFDVVQRNIDFKTNDQ